MWLATGQRRTSLHIARLVSGFLAMLVLLGPAAGAAPADAADRGTPPAPLLGSGLQTRLVTTAAAERLLGAPLLDASGLHDHTHDLGIWAATLDGPFGHTAVVFHVYTSARHSWLTLLELRSERPMQESPWELIIAQPTTVGSYPARLYVQPGSVTVSWQQTPTLHVSLSEDSQQGRTGKSFSDWSPQVAILDQDAFLRLAATLHPRGVQVGPFRLDLPWA